jgi:hypothetical protein
MFFAVVDFVKTVAPLAAFEVEIPADGELKRLSEELATGVSCAFYTRLHVSNVCT